MDHKQTDRAGGSERWREGGKDAFAISVLYELARTGEEASSHQMSADGPEKRRVERTSEPTNNIRLRGGGGGGESLQPRSWICSLRQY